MARPSRRAALFEGAQPMLPLLAILVPVAALAGIVMARAAWYHVEQARRYDPKVLIGLTAAQAKARLGDPFEENGMMLFYQTGNDPDAVLHLMGGKVVRVECFK